MARDKQATFERYKTMARKKKSSLAEELIAIAALLPCWLSVALALLLYVILNGYAQTPVELAHPPKPHDLGRMMTAQMVRSAASVGQYILPFLLLVGAVMSVILRRRRVALLESVAQIDDALAVLLTMSWQQFELVVGQWFRTQGYRVVDNMGGGADGGVDLRLTKDHEQFIVQCKQWRATKVGVTIVRELYGVMAAEGATGGFVVTAGSFTGDAIAFATGRNLQLIDGSQLARIMRTAVDSTLIAAPTPPRNPHGSNPVNSPPCPLCSKAMVRRTAKHGASAGQSFFGCSAYPSCKGTAAL